MDSTDFKILLHLVDRKIRRSKPTTAEHWRGYCRGIKEYLHHLTEEAAHDRHQEIIDQNRGEPCFEAYARGYCDGCNARMNSNY